MFQIIKIQGDSMLPRYQSGDFVLIGRLGIFFSLKLGDDAVFPHDRYGILVKQVRDIDTTHIWFEGLNATSLKSQQMGKIAKSSILGKVLFTFNSSKRN